MVWATVAAAAVTVGTSLYTSSKNRKAAEQAAEIEAEGAAEGRDLLAEQFQATQETLDPFVQGGLESFRLQQAQTGALGPEEQAKFFADFQEDPGTQFIREQGLRNIDLNAAATGRLGSGSRLKSILQFNQNLALQNLGNRFNQLGAGTGVGLNAAQAVAGVGGSSAAGQANLINQGAAATGQGIRQANQAFTSGVEQAAGAVGGGLTSFFADREAARQRDQSNEVSGIGLIPGIGG